MIRPTFGVLLLGLACVGTAGAQSRYADYYSQTYGNAGDVDRRGARDDRSDDGRYDSGDGGAYDYARVVRVDPIIAPPPPPQQQCYTRAADDGYTQGGDYYDGNGNRQQSTPGGRTTATIVGGVLGAVVGSRFGDGGGRLLGTAVGTAAGTAMGQSVYDNSHTTTGTVRVCEPVSDRRRGDDGEVEGYDVTYEYAGRDYHTRTAYHPGDRIRVRVDVVAAQD